MTDTRLDSGEIKKRQQADWNAVSNGWEKWWDTLEQGARHVSERMMDMAELQENHRVLDIATGIGEPALSAAQRVGPAGHVLATDQARHMLAIAEKRARQSGMDNLTFQEIDGESLQGINGQFDAVLCRWGLMFFPTLDIALKNINHQLIKGGKFATAVWSTPDKVPTISLSMNVVREKLQTPPPPPGTPNPFNLSNTDSLIQAFQIAGFENVRCESVNVTFSMPNAQAYTEFTRDISAPVAALVSELDTDAQREIWASLTEAARAYEAEDGSIQMINEAFCIVGTHS